ncbi:DNA repair ATPase [Actinoplanes sp. NPDC051851]|uniref:DNA repair ATPase n=1 Tax=Actinoplanes sp. NPDC051851 TaxID=3154753 RepID=UPI003447B731
MTIDAGTYEVLRSRLGAKARELADRAEALNARRVEAFGAQQTSLLGTERIRTGNNCVARDVAPAGDALLFGGNAFLGLKAETAVEDVLVSLDREFQPHPVPGLLDDPGFRRDFAELYRYYRETRLVRLWRVEQLLLAVFQTGARADDRKVLRWRIGVDGSVTYLDARGERDAVAPPPYDFEWTLTTREQHVLGRHPHVSIEDEVFVETVGGTLTVKVEDNTEDGEGIFSEPVDEPLQSLADAEIGYARVGALILLRVLPYQETAYRYLVFNTRTRDVRRLDGIGQACRRLPDDQGVIFPGGYYLATGVAKTFDADTAGLEFERVVRSVNGEDVLYVFHAAEAGRYLLLPYNVIRKEVATPIGGLGYAIFDDGVLVVLRGTPDDEPARIHPVQLWQTPYVAEEAAPAAGSGPLERVGNADLVRGIADALVVTRMVDEMSAAGPVFEAIIAACTRAFDNYHWLGDAELEDLAAPLHEVRTAAKQVLDEFASVVALQEQAATAVTEAATKADGLVRDTDADWLRRLSDLRRERGHVAGLREMRYIDLARLDEIDAALATATDETARRAVEILRRPDAFAAYQKTVDELAAKAAAVETVAEASPVAERIAEQSDGLQVVTEVVGGLEIADATVRVSILEQIGTVLGGLNRARATLDGRRRELASVEGRAAFAAEFALFGQSVAAALAAADTPERCDEQLAKLMAQVENLETRFADVDDFGDRLAAKRTEVYEAISGRRQSLLDERARRADRLAESARRILAAVHRRIATLGDPDEVNTYFATDPMPAKVRSVAQDLRELGDTVRAEELDGLLKAARQEAGRALRDRLDLFGDGGIRLGRHVFAVNEQAIDLTLVPHDGGLAYAITGTDYRAPVTDPAFAGTRPFWDQPLISENREIYRAEHLAAAVLAENPGIAGGGTLREVVRRAAEARYEEGYERGVHDADATAILEVLLRLHAGAGLLRFEPSVRVEAQLFWAFGASGEQRASWQLRAASLVRARQLFGSAGTALDDLRAELDAAAGTDVGGYLIEELATAPAGFATSAGARTFLDRFHRELGGSEAARQYTDDLRALADSPEMKRQLVQAWLEAFHQAKPDSGERADMLEAIGVEVAGTALTRYDVSAALTESVSGLLGVHPRITDGRLDIRLDDLLARATTHRQQNMPGYRIYQQQRAALAAAERERLRLDEFKPRVMTTFVRNRLLDDVYLPLIGDNLARQLGAAGDDKRTDRSGLLLLISPPGYGKTTLMEYVADRLGLVFVKVNGPALGHGVTSLDPAEAPNATARQEVEKISLALEMGNNVLLYLDDIQHTDPELLQKFISLCDAQRRMEGVWDGRTRTYDLRGKRFAVCMAGNPYTETGRRFRVPDMLANRADVWNLGDVLSGREDLFELSYLENALTTNPVLAPLAARDRDDLTLLLRLAEGDETAKPAHPYSAAELEQILAVLRKMRRAQRVVLRVNQAYIASAAQADASRTEPPFKLQGSYRNMNKLAERIVPAMNDDELETVLDDHYLGEAQTLTGGAEANLLKLAEIRDRLTPEQAARWADVKAAYLREQALGGDGSDPLSRVGGAVGLVADRVAGIEAAISRLRPGSAAAPGPAESTP